MRLFLLISLTMMAFAANSILNRLAVDRAGIGAESFAVIRVAAGATILMALAWGQNLRLSFISARRLAGAGALATYMVGFSLAYGTLDAGAGALILFGATQVAMFGAAALSPTRPTPRQLAGAGVALAGLAWVLWPGQGAAVPAGGAGLMLAAGLGWAVYSLIGRGESDALGATTASFVLALPLVLIAMALPGAQIQITTVGVFLAILSGAVTSGLGYALWYRLLPGISSVTAASVMLSVPIIALIAGVLLLGETVGIKLLLGGGIVLGGIGFAIRER